jgi:alpha-amylase
MNRRSIGSLAGAAVLGAGLLTAPALASTAPAAPVPDAPAPAPGAVAAAEQNGGTIVHLFQWNWDSVAAECEDFLGPHGFGGVQVSPPQEHVVIPSAEGGDYPWWQDYQPVSYQIDNTRRGTAEEFEAMVATCRDNGVRIYADVVINHMTGPGSGTGSNGTEWEKYAYPDLFGDGAASYGRDDFGPCFETISDWNDKWEVQNCELLELSNLNTASPHVRAQLTRYLNGLVEMGVGGFRVDAAKHVAEADVEAIFGGLDDVPGFGGPPDVYHEVYGDQTVPYTAYTPYGRVTNFDYKDDFAGRFARGDIAGLVDMPDYGGLTADEAVVFVDNHDTQRYTPTLTYKDGDRYRLATAFMLAHPYGTPVVMSSYDFGDNQTEGPPSTGEAEGNPAGWITADTDCSSADWVCEHRDDTVAGMAAFRNATDGAGITERAADGPSRVAFDRGDRGFAAFNAGSGTWRLTAGTALPDGVYENAAGGGTATVSGGEVTVDVPAEGAVALHADGVCDGSAECGGDGNGDGDAVQVSARVETFYGQEVYVVGNTAALGSWNPASGVRLTTTEHTYPQWTGTVPVGADDEWKLVRIDGSGRVEWESGANRVGPDPAPAWRN